MKTKSKLTTILLAGILPLTASAVDGYKDLKFGASLADIREKLSSACERVETSENSIRGIHCYTIAGKKRNIDAYFYKYKKTLAQIEFDFIKDDMIYRIDESVVETTMDGLKKNYTFDKASKSNGYHFASFEDSSVVLMVGSPWNGLLQINVPAFKLIYSDKDQSKIIKSKYNLGEANKDEY